MENNTDFINFFLNQMSTLFGSGVVNFAIVLGITMICQLLKQIKIISRFAIVFPIFFGLMLLLYNIFVLQMTPDTWPIIFFGYAGGSVFLYYLLKKALPGFFKSNYNVINNNRRTKK